MLIKKHHKISTDIIVSVKEPRAEQPLRYYSSFPNNDWPLHDSSDSVCSFSSAPSFSDDEDDDKKLGKDDDDHDDTKHRLETTVNHSNTPCNTIHVPRTHNSHDATSTTIPNHANDSNSRRGGEPDKSTILTGELLQIGTLAVLGVVGFLVVFTMGAVVGERRRDHRQSSFWEPSPPTGSGRGRGVYQRQSFRGW